jgi:hypothetical protein
MRFFLGFREGFREGLWDSYIENHRLLRLTVNASPLITLTDWWGVMYRPPLRRDQVLYKT